jgi:uncharacterized phage protein (TIGR01671 family)
VNREIKFRAWNKTTNKMIDVHAITPLVLTGEMEGVFLPFLDNIVLQQYTGFKDNKNKDIYEGDILKCNNRTVNKFIEVKWEAEKAAFTFENRFIPYFLEFKDVTIVGNIFENPELCK